MLRLLFPSNSIPDCLAETRSSLSVTFELLISSLDSFDCGSANNRLEGLLADILRSLEGVCLFCGYLLYGLFCFLLATYNCNFSSPTQRLVRWNPIWSLNFSSVFCVLLVKRILFAVDLRQASLAKLSVFPKREN